MLHTLDDILNKLGTRENRVLYLENFLRAYFSKPDNIIFTVLVL